jgi:predicted amidohydrolase YtcJ
MRDIFRWLLILGRNLGVAKTLSVRKFYNLKNRKQYIKAGWMIDGTGAPVQEQVLLTVEEGVITAIDSSRGVDLPDQSSLKNRHLCSNQQGKREVIEQNLEHQLVQMAKAKQYGVQLALGTDAGCSGIPHGESVVEELKLFMKAGYSLVEAIQCASSNGAKLLGIQKIGPIEKGRPALFNIARATPAMLPERLSCLETISFKH